MAKNERTIGDVVDRELESLRQEQAKAVMPLIGPMLDAWEALPNDVLRMDELSDLAEAIADIVRGMDGDLPDSGDDKHD